MHREHDAAGVGALEQLEQLRPGAVEAVGVVVAEMGVGVEDLDAGNLVPRAVEQGQERGIGLHGGADYPQWAR